MKTSARTVVLGGLLSLPVAWPGGLAAQEGAGREAAAEIASTIDSREELARRLEQILADPALARAFLAALPTAGVDGTMHRRLIATPDFENVRAKTGSLSAVRGLSGYLLDGSGETLLFSLLINGYDAPGPVAVALEDLLIEQVALYRRPVEPGWPRLRPLP